MKNTLAIILIVLPGILFGQAAGNYYFNQKQMPASTNSASVYQGNYGNQTYQQNYQTPYYGSHQVADSVMALHANVLFNVKPDAYTMVLGLTQVGEGLEDTHLKINERIGKLKDGLENLGISKDVVYRDFISQAPIFGMEVEKKLFSKNYVEVPVGFEVKKNLHLRFDNIESLEEIINLAAKQEIYDIIEVAPLVYERDKVYDSLRNACAQVLKSKRDIMHTLGLKIHPMFNSLSETITCHYPIHQYRSYTSYIDHTRKRLKKDERLVSAGGNINLFYSGYNDTKCDRVIHPEYTGPVLQFVMHMNMLFTMERIEE